MNLLNNAYFIRGLPLILNSVPHFLGLRFPPVQFLSLILLSLFQSTQAHICAFTSLLSTGTSVFIYIHLFQ